MLLQRADDRWQVRRTDAEGRTREPSPLACLPPGRLLLSANPTLLELRASGGGPSRTELLAFDAANPAAAYRVIAPEWQGRPAFNQHSYRSREWEGTMSYARVRIQPSAVAGRTTGR